MKQRAEITFEIEETIVVRQGEKLSREFCPLCGIVVDMLTPQFATAASKKPVRQIFRLIEAGKVHFSETDGGLICLDCLTASSAEQ
ncbi:MAG: hypothetical protein LC768_14105 [Acidobacteria bacterium]|nr:hypothetical protein [Acidobacteriota bacterium]MCA1639446.1 hypothetical protein [Acidobacteriota bacterium]